MKNLIQYIVIALFLFIGPDSNGQCPNGNLENGNFTNWTNFFGDYTRRRKEINNMQQTTVTGSHAIVSSAPTDPNTNNIVTQGIEGQFALKLGGTTPIQTPGKSQMSNYTFTVTNANKNFKFQYAIVITDFQHSDKRQPFFQYWVTKKGKNIPSIWNYSSWKLYSSTKKKIIADAGDPFFNQTGQRINTGAPIIYRDWTCKNIDLSDYVGEQVTVHFLSSDCEPGPDWGYVYIDALCEQSPINVDFTLPNVACKGSEIPLDASATTNEDHWFVSVQESDANWNRYGTEYTQWYTAQKAGQLDLTEFANKKGLDFKCGKYYRVKIAGASECNGWSEKTKLIKIECPEISFPDDYTVCCPRDPRALLTIPIIGNIDEYIINASASNGAEMTLDWNTASYTTSFPTDNTTYTFQITSPHGCTITKEFKVFVKKPLKVDIQHLEANSCGEVGTCYDILKANVQVAPCHSNNWRPNDESVTYTWSPSNENSQTIELSGDNVNHTDFTVSVSNGCFSDQATIGGMNTGLNVAITGPYPALDARNDAMNLNSAYAINRKITIYDGTKDFGDPLAYNATAYKLLIFNRWGELIRTVEDCNPSGFNNGDIFWDGKVDNGNYVPTGVYVSQLYLKNCSHEDFRLITKYAVLEEDGTKCLDWVTAWGVKLWCRLKTTNYKTVIKHVNGGVNKMTVVRL